MPGNMAALKHGTFAIIATGKLPSIDGKEKIEKHLSRLSLNLERAVGEMSVQKELLIRQVVRCEAMMKHVEVYMEALGTMIDTTRWKTYKKIEFQPCMSQYMKFLEVQRRALSALGINEMKLDKVRTPFDLAAEVDAEKAGRKRR
ncbi:MAG: hypothetical protein HWN68_06515 [Desulfobacterales bacterium]|nr:hypothetical protein [Desulfobacterales bacterium]